MSAQRMRDVRRPTFGRRPVVVRGVRRPDAAAPPQRPPSPPHGPTHRDVLRHWEETEQWSCTYCDRDFGPTMIAEMDHVTPLAKGGLHTWWNLAPACRDCNRSKSDLDVAVWLGISADQREPESDAPVT
ncbi:HNH endonuclease [Streptomyces sp. NPDC020141]|uniref:HNH endonuclease n=1 Tax=Streptomyces sp. NPDC020141 TaxID=3365065 RepID=UPI0037AC3CC3